MKIGDTVTITDPPAGWSDVTGTVTHLSHSAVIVAWDNDEECWEDPARLSTT